MKGKNTNRAQVVIDMYKQQHSVTAHKQKLYETKSCDSFINPERTGLKEHEGGVV